jgi:hypothetical protein
MACRAGKGFLNPLNLLDDPEVVEVLWDLGTELAIEGA